VSTPVHTDSTYHVKKKNKMATARTSPPRPAIITGCLEPSAGWSSGTAQSHRERGGRWGNQGQLMYVTASAGRSWTKRKLPLFTKWRSAIGELGLWLWWRYPLGRKRVGGSRGL